MEEKRNIEVSLKQAVEWYCGNNETLRKLALTVYTEDELKLSINYICSSVYKKVVPVIIPASKKDKFKALADLALIAEYFNDGWEKNSTNYGFYISMCCNSIHVLRDIKMQTGVVYFKNPEDAQRAIKILGDKVKRLFD